MESLIGIITSFLSKLLLIKSSPVILVGVGRIMQVDGRAQTALTTIQATPSLYSGHPRYPIIGPGRENR